MGCVVVFAPHLSTYVPACMYPSCSLMAYGSESIEQRGPGSGSEWFAKSSNYLALLPHTHDSACMALPCLQDSERVCVFFLIQRINGAAEGGFYANGCWQMFLHATVASPTTGRVHRGCTNQSILPASPTKAASRLWVGFCFAALALHLLRDVCVCVFAPFNYAPCLVNRN